MIFSTIKNFLTLLLFITGAFFALVFLTPSTAYAVTDIYTAGQVKALSDTELTLTLETDGYKFAVTAFNGSYRGYTYFPLDNSVAFTSGDELEYVYSGSWSGCLIGAPTFILRDNVTPSNMDTNSITPASDTVTNSVHSSTLGVTGTFNEVMTKNNNCDIGSYITLHAMTLNGTVIFDFTDYYTPAPATSATPPVIYFDTDYLLGTSTCTPNATDTICTYDYITSTTTDSLIDYTTRIDFLLLMTSIAFFLMMITFTRSLTSKFL